MARHQVLQHRLVSCTSAIPHPFCQRHPKIQSRACVTSRAGSAFAPARRSHRLGVFVLPLSRPPTLRVDARLIFDLNNSTTTETSILIDNFFDTTPLHRNHSAATEQLQLQRAATEQRQLQRGQTLTMHPHDAGQLHSSIRPSVTLHRHDAFLS